MGKYIFVVGGVMSGVGKGITTSSIGKILQSRGFSVTALKIDPYINVDAGTMNPTEHGEVFVLKDGYETDQDMGNYERFLDMNLPNDNYMTTGRVYLSVIEKERNLEYKGKCVEVVPHIPLEVIRRIENAQKKSKADITLVEIGGTIGEYQNVLFLEAARMMKSKYPQDVLFVLVSYLPIPNKIGEMKTKPTQYAARTLQGAGIQPDFIIGRSEKSIDKKRKEKIAMFCNVSEEDVISAPDIDSIYEVPLNFEKDNLSELILKKLHLDSKKTDLKEWKFFVDRLKSSKKKVRIGIAGKYFTTGDFVLSDSYISVIESIKHAGALYGFKPEILWIDAEKYENDPKALDELKDLHGLIVPGGFGSRGIEGKILAIQYVREQKIPFLGICYGMQMSIVEYARNIVGMKDAHTTEINPKTSFPVIDILPEQKELLEKKNYGGSMRLGSYIAEISPQTIANAAYKKERISERHRHRYEMNPQYIEKLETAGMIFSGKSPNKRLMEIVELPRKVHPFFVGTQFHPELQSRPLTGHPLFNEFLKKSGERKKNFNS
ncbi:MAG: CTP synthase [Candidatus Moraniibacteriota bacterium]|nr:MAG: CTP synthase [Candidatus Moranbacteria bacterium]